MNSNINHIFFLGIGGIGMSALARYYFEKGYAVSGYDRTPTVLTQSLEKENITITYEDNTNTISELAKDARHTLVVRTPAVPQDSVLYQFFLSAGHTILKRAELLGETTREMKALCVAGTHGKTTTSTMLAHLLYSSEVGCNAFLGGISKNYGSNLLLQPESGFVVIEADEFDRSFHHLTPYMSIITSADADHLDIYGDLQHYRESFEHYTSLIRKGGVLLLKQGVEITPRLQQGVKLYTYGVQENENSRNLEISKLENLDFYADNIRTANEQIVFDFHALGKTIADLRLGVPVWVNIENAVAAMALAWLNGVTEYELRLGIESFQGVERRFNIHYKSEKQVLIDDYAHHPEEIRQSINSIRRIFPTRCLTGVFQPHLYTRTRDFADDFAAVLSTLDEVILLPIYPARELPIEGVNSRMLLSKITCTNKSIHVKEGLSEYLAQKEGVVLILGAGDIADIVPDIRKAMKNNASTNL